MKYTPRRKLPTMLCLQAFEAVARLLNVTRAGEDLALSQSAVSRQVAELERFLGVFLFARVRKRLTLTPAGSAYLARVRVALNGLEAATFDLRTHRGESGPLNVSVPSTWGNKWLLPRLAAFAAAQPRVVLNLSTQIGRVDFAQPGIDAAVVFGDGAIPDTESHFVMRLDLIAVAAPALLRSHPPVRRAEDLARLPLLHQSTVPNAWADYFVACGAGAVRVPGGSRYALLSMGLQGALAGLGAALLPPYLVAEEIRRRRLRKPLPKVLTLREAYYLHVPLAHRDLPAVKSFREWLLGVAAEASDPAG